VTGLTIVESEAIFKFAFKILIESLYNAEDIGKRRIWESIFTTIYERMREVARRNEERSREEM
jgi:hypothetical protein